MVGKTVRAVPFDAKCGASDRPPTNARVVVSPVSLRRRRSNGWSGPESRRNVEWSNTLQNNEVTLLVQHNSALRSFILTTHLKGVVAHSKSFLRHKSIMNKKNRRAPKMKTTVCYRCALSGRQTILATPEWLRRQLFDIGRRVFVNCTCNRAEKRYHIFEAAYQRGDV